LAKSDGYYFSARQGLRLLPIAMRWSAAVWLEYQREIGFALAKQNYNPLYGPVRLTEPQKWLLNFQALRCWIPGKGSENAKMAHNFSWRNSHANIGGVPRGGESALTQS
jgi:hypothetical protein